MERYWLWLQQKEKISVKAKLRLLSAFGTPEAVFLATEAELAAVCNLKREAFAELTDHDLAHAEAILRACYEKNIRIIPLDAPDYPKLLREIADPPLVLFCEGVLPELDEELTIAVVGHRKPTTNGWAAAHRLGYELSKSGVIVVSGGAAGIDTAALQGALRGGSPVIAVVGGGSDRIYPRENRRLFADIRDYGCILSEYPPGTEPLGWHFPIRNRILSGLCRGTVVVEAPRKSGSLITAQHALEQGRDVFAVPGSAGEALCAGSNDLLRQGAVYAEYANDVIAQYLNLFRERIRLLSEEELSSYRMTETEHFDANTELIAASPVRIPTVGAKKVIDNPPAQAYIDLQEMPAGLSPAEEAVLRAVTAGAERTDEIVERTDLCAADVLCALTMLEIYGHIRPEAGGRFIRNLKA